MSLAELIPAIAGRQGGVFTAAQALAEGWTRRQIRRRLAAGRWCYVAGRGIAVPQFSRPSGASRRSQTMISEGGWTAFQLAFAAHLTVPGAVISHLTAGSLHRFPLASDREVVAHVISHQRHDVVPGVEIHRLKLAADDAGRSASGLVVTSPARTALDLFAWMSFGQALDLWAWTSTRNILDAGMLESAIAGRRRWHGSPRLRALWAAVSRGAGSGGELRLHGVLTEAGITGWTAAATIRDGAGIVGVVDVLFPGLKLVIEFDGWRAHSSRGSFVHDRRRQNRLVAAGYVVLRFTWDDLMEQPGEVVRQIRLAASRLAA